MEDNPLHQLPQFLRQHLLLFLICLIGLLLVGGGLILSFALTPSESVVFEESTMDEGDRSSMLAEITIDIQGAVKKPGVYTLPSDSRIKDALLAAGGTIEEADSEYLAKQINLAQKLSDSSKVYIPYEGEVLSAVGSSSTSGLINLNTASLSELDTLPKIGPVTAQKIIDNRPYSSVNDLKSKKVLSASVFSAIEKLVAVQ